MPIDVILNVYDLIDQTPLCCGFFHTGVEILGCEYSFGQGGGVYECTPKSAPDGRFRESIVMGTIESTSIARSALDRVRPDFPGDGYNLVFKNCNDFSTAYVKACLNGTNIPGWINRLARMGRMWPVRCFLPPHLKGNAASTTAPLLAAQPQLFQGSGQSLRDDVARSSGGGSSVNTSSSRSALSCIGSRFRSFFSRQQDSTPSAIDGTNSNTALIANEGNARELRAAAASRRLDSSDLEGGGSGRSGAPVPNPWQ